MDQNQNQNQNNQDNKNNQNQSISGLKWLLNLVDHQGEWFKSKSQNLMRFMGATSDVSVQFLDPRAWISMLISGTGQYFSGAATLLVGIIPAIIKDICNMLKEPSKSLASIVTTPIYAISMGSFYLLFSTLCIGGVIILTVGGVITTVVLIAYWGIKNAGNFISNGLRSVFQKALN